MSKYKEILTDRNEYLYIKQSVHIDIIGDPHLHTKVYRKRRGFLSFFLPYKKLTGWERELPSKYYELDLIPSSKRIEYIKSSIETHYNYIEGRVKNSDDFDNWHGSFTDDKHRIREMRLKKILDK